MRPILALATAVVTACSALSAGAATMDVGQSTALNWSSYGGAVPSSAYPGGAPLYTDNGFVWQNQSGYAGDCQSGQGNTSAATIFTLDNLYDHEGCGNNLGMVRMDGSTFSVGSINVSARDYTKVTPASSVVASGTNFLPFQLTESDIAADLDAAGVLPFTPEADAILAQKNAENAKATADYQAWLNSSTNSTRDRFYVVGYRNGAEVARQVYGDTGGLTSLALSGFTNIDEIVFGYHGENFLWDHYYLDYGGYSVLGPGQTWCSYYCEVIDIHGFNFTTPGGNVTPVPLPPGAWLMGAALGLLGWSARKRA